MATAKKGKIKYSEPKGFFPKEIRDKHFSDKKKTTKKSK